MFFIGKMNNPLAIAGTAAANQIFTSTFWVVSFLPLVITPLIATAYANKDMEG
jgi:Na+-driven multidrug efflux pump